MEGYILYDKGILSTIDALEVGCMVEVIDVDKLDGYIALAEAINVVDILDTFNILRDGSYIHYWAFDDALKQEGIVDGCCSLEPAALGYNFCHPEYPRM